MMLQFVKKLKSAIRSPQQNPTNTAPISRSLRFNCPYEEEESVEDVVQGRLHPVNIGDVFGSYRVVRKLGSGRFSTSWLVTDESSQKYACFKMVSAAHSSSTRDGSNESHILRLVRSSLPQSDLDRECASHHIVKFIDAFQFEGPLGLHDCIVTEVLGSSLQSIRWGDDNTDWSLPKPLVKKVARHVLHALELLHETCGIIHGDIKRDNVLLSIPNLENIIGDHLRNTKTRTLAERADGIAIWESQPISAPGNLSIQEMDFKLVDFGSGSLINDVNETYRPANDFCAPEVLLGAPRGTAIDIWTLACALFEMTTSRPLFYHYRPGTDDQVAHLGQIIRRLGDIPRDVIDAGRHRDVFYDEQGEFRGGLEPPRTIFESVTNILRADGIVEPEEETKNFVEFIEGMTRLRPSDRMKASELLRCAWLAEE